MDQVTDIILAVDRVIVGLALSFIIVELAVK